MTSGLCLGLLVLQLGKLDRDPPPNPTSSSTNPSISAFVSSPPPFLRPSPVCDYVYVHRHYLPSLTHTYNAMCFLMQSPLSNSLFYVCVCIYVCVCVCSSSAHSDLASPLTVIKQTPGWLTHRHTYSTCAYT